MKTLITCLIYLLSSFLFCKGDSSGTLPVELIYFEADILESSVMLKWGTATELENYGFEIQRTSGNMAEWNILGFVSGHGTSYVTHHYLFEDTTVIFNNLYYYRLKQLDNNGGFAYKDTIFVYFTTGIDESSYDLEAEYSLHQNYPNPFNPETIIPFKIIEDGYYRISLYNISGEYVKEITSGYFSKGDYNTKLVAEKLTSGVYFYRLEAAKGEFLQMKLIILK